MHTTCSTLTALPACGCGPTPRTWCDISDDEVTVGDVVALHLPVGCALFRVDEITDHGNFLGVPAVETRPGRYDGVSDDSMVSPSFDFGKVRSVLPMWDAIGPVVLRRSHDWR